MSVEILYIFLYSYFLGSIPFGLILTGSNRCTLIPLNASTPHEINIAEKMNFYSRISFHILYHECDHINIFLISYLKTDCYFCSKIKSRDKLFFIKL